MLKNIYLNNLIINKVKKKFLIKFLLQIFDVSNYLMNFLDRCKVLWKTYSCKRKEANTIKHSNNSSTNKMAQYFKAKNQ